MIKDKIFNQFPELETDRLRLRELKISDAQDVFEIFSNSQVMKYYNLYPLDCLEQAEELIRNYQLAFKEQRILKWGLEYKKEGKLIGSCGLYNWQSDFARATIGYELGSEYWEQGLMTEALTAVLEFAFMKMRLNRIQALVEPPNQSSRQLLKKLGFKKEGLLRDYMFYKGEYRDLLMYSLLKTGFI